MEQVVCEARIRKEKGKGAAHKVRRQGLVPAILYSKGAESIMLNVETRDLQKVLSSKAGLNVIINLKIKDNGKQSDEAMAMISEVQRDIFQKMYLHVDFHRIRMDEKVRATVSLSFQGHAKGEKEGGMTDHLRYDIEIEGLPGALPQRVEIDVTGLEIGDSLHVRDLKLPEGVVPLTDRDEMVVVVHAPRAHEEAAPTAEAAAAADTTLGAAAPAAPQ